jgi:IMP dehydrogenase
MFRTTYSYADIGLIPTKCSLISSRSEINPSITFLGHISSLPIIVAPMETVVGANMVFALQSVHGLCCLPRTNDIQTDLELFHLTASAGRTRIPSIGIHKGSFSAAVQYASDGAKTICVDIANGFNTNVKDLILELKNNLHFQIIAGNVGSVEGYAYMAELGVDAVRVGIGNGGICSTSISTGLGIGQATLIRDIAEWKTIGPWEAYAGGIGRRPPPLPSQGWPLIIADGGIRVPGDVVKALALGADLVMIGKLFAGCEESPGEVVKFNDKLYKRFAGQASFAIKRNRKYVEGDDTLVPYSGPVINLWHRFEDGLRSGMAYLNCPCIDSLKNLSDENICLLSDAAKLERNIHANL